MQVDMSKAELLGAISGMLDVRFAEQEEKLDKKLDKRFAEQEEKLDKKLDKRFAEQERYLMNSILEEVDRVQEKANSRFERIGKRLDNIEMILRTRRTDLEYRITVLERKVLC